MGEHTRGPWVYKIYRKDDGSFAKVATVAHCCEYVIGIESDIPGGNYRDGLPEGDPEADARLIAAAPDLLKALEEITDSFAAFMGGEVVGAERHPTIKAARAALDAARTRS